MTRALPLHQMVNMALKVDIIKIVTTYEHCLSVNSSLEMTIFKNLFDLIVYMSSFLVNLFQ